MHPHTKYIPKRSPCLVWLAKLWLFISFMERYIRIIRMNVHCNRNVILYFTTCIYFRVPVYIYLQLNYKLYVCSWVFFHWKLCLNIKSCESRSYYHVSGRVICDPFYMYVMSNHLRETPPPPPPTSRSIPGGPKKNGTVDTFDFSGLCSDQQSSFFTLLDRASFPHYNNTKIIKFGWELFILWVISYGLSFSGFDRFPEFGGTINDKSMANPKNDSP